MSFRDTLVAVAALKVEGVVEDYAIGGAMALVFWSEPVATYDLDVFVLLPPSDGLILSLGSVYDWAERKGFSVQKEHILIGGVPVQIIPAHNQVAEEAVREAAPIEYDDIAVRVIRPEYLIALYLEPSARTRKRLERVAALLEGGQLDRNELASILQRHDLTLPEDVS